MDFRRRFPLRLGRPAVADEVDAELEFHLEMRRRELMARGMSEDEARRAALEKFGDMARARQRCRDIGEQRERRMRVLQDLSELRQDAAYALRQMLAAPAFSGLAVATLAFGIAATTAIFSAVHAVVLRPLPLPEPERLVVVSSGWGGGLMSVAPGHYLHLEQEEKVFQSLAARAWASFALARTEGAERVVGARVTGEFFDVFGVQPALGRVFGPPQDAPGRDGVVVLSHRLWTRLFGADPGVVGKDITLDERRFTVVGVMPAAFDLSADSDELWVPMAFTSEERALRTSHFLTVYARLRPAVTLQQAAEQMKLVIDRRLRAFPDESAGRTLHVTPLMRRFVGEYRDRLYLLLAAVGLVLLIACGNVSNLLLARAAVRSRELAVRSALGAGQGRLVRQLLTESVVLGLVSAAAGVAAATWLIKVLVAFGPEGVPRLEQARIDGAVLAFAGGLAVATSVVFGLVPAWRAARADVNATLKETGRGAGSHGARDLVRSTLIAAEVALALVLLVGAGLLIRTALEMQRIDPGFDPERLYTARVLLPAAGYGTAARMQRAAEDIEAAVGRIPGVTAAAVVSAIPGGRSFSNGLLPEGRALDLKNITQSDGVIVSPAYFATMRLAIVRGRPFTDADRAGAPLAVILNETAVHQMWPGQDAIGKRLTSANPLGPTTVVGIAADARLGGPSEPAPPTFYVPGRQMNDEAWSWARSPFVVARTQGDPAAIGPTVRRVVAEIDPGIPLFGVMTMEERMAATIETARFNTVLLGVLGAAGLMLAAGGIYGVVAYFAAQRRAEIGIRMALGATRRDVVRLVVRQAAAPVLMGIAIGAAGATLAARALAAQLVNVGSTDPLTFAAVSAFVLLVAVLAALLPARSAARLDPNRALQTT